VPLRHKATRSRELSTTSDDTPTTLSAIFALVAKFIEFITAPTYNRGVSPIALCSDPTLNFTIWLKFRETAILAVGFVMSDFLSVGVVGASREFE
jgi:hypothetical protein